MFSKYDKILYNALLEKGLIDKKGLEPVKKEAEESGISFQKLLVRRRVLPEQDILDILAESMKLSRVNIKNISIDKAVLDKIPVKVASYYRFIPIELKGSTLTIAVPEPLNIKMQDEIRTQLGYSIEVVLACDDDISEGLKKYYGLAADTLESISSKEAKKNEAYSEDVRGKVEDIEKLAGDASVIRLVNQIILEAYRRRSTDIHIEPYRGGVALRYRIDGILYEAAVPPDIRNFLSAIISRIKIMSNLNIVERRLPQDGRAVVRVQDNVLDLRVSIIPTPHGESIVIRILPTQMLYSLEKLGLPKRELAIFENLILKPHGIIFVTGPTGSGKTTTLYACLSKINTKDRKIITIEDPIEYEMSGITQIQVMPQIGLDFARGLRSMLRHDPDIMMVGEVRDLETAEIAIRVALTGHLVFSTLHTNDAASGVARLVDVGLEPYLIASSLEAIIAQRLVRVICPHCKSEDKKAALELKKTIAEDLGLKSADSIKIFRGKGCNECNLTGFFGRTATYEILLVDDSIRELIAKRMPSSEMKKLAIKKGMRTLRQDGWERVIAGVTTPEEVMRVTQAEDKSGSTAEAPLGLNLVNGMTFPEISDKGQAKDAAQEEMDHEEDDKMDSSADEEGVLPFDRRIYARLMCKVNLRYKIFDSKKDLLGHKYVPEHMSVSKNLSAGGLSFDSQELLAIGSILELSIELSDGKKPITCLARVTRLFERVMDKMYDVGVCFLDIAAAEKNRINSFVKKNLKS
ncbi:MAG: ATPase, T2SS/T4P/T4SS family [Candidatus Omnitrophota bacterium]